MRSISPSDFEDIDDEKDQIRFDTRNNSIMINEINTKEIRREELTSARVRNGGMNLSQSFTTKNSDSLPNSPPRSPFPDIRLPIKDKSKTDHPQIYKPLNQNDELQCSINDTMRSAGPLDETMRSAGALDETRRTINAEDTIFSDESRGLLSLLK